MKLYEPAGNAAVVEGDELDGSVLGASALCISLTLLSNIQSCLVPSRFLLVQPNHEADSQGHRHRGHHDTDEAYPLPSASACNVSVVPHLP